MRRRGGRKIPTIFGDAALDLFRGQALLLRSGKTIKELIDGNGMPFEIRKFYRRKSALSFSFDFFFSFFFPFFIFFSPLGLSSCGIW